MSPDPRARASSLPPSGGSANLTAAEALELARSGAIFVDIREAYETNFRVFDVPRVAYVPWTVFRERRGTLPREATLVVVDASGTWCREAARLLVEDGYANVAKLAGGMIEWDAGGFPVRRDDEYELRGQCACKMKSRHGGNPLLERQDAREPGDGGRTMTRVLFLCVHNSARSQMAEAFLRAGGEGRYETESAGLEPGRLNPFVVRAMGELGIDISGNATKSVFDLAAAGKSYDVVVTVCSKEAAERCPVFPGKVERLHWFFDDPSGFKGSDDEVMGEVRRVRDEIRAAVESFVESRR